MTIRYENDNNYCEYNKERIYIKCPLCTRVCRGNANMIRHKEKVHGVEVKRY
jgi:uncharacterized C2H2 Zn-finger protein